MKIKKGKRNQVKFIKSWGPGCLRWAHKRSDVAMCCVVATGQSDLESSVELSQPAGLAAENRPWHWPSFGGTVSRERCPIIRSLWRPSELGLERSQAYFKYVFLIYVTEFCANSIIRRSGLLFGHFHENSRCKLRGKKKLKLKIFTNFVQRTLLSTKFSQND